MKCAALFLAAAIGMAVLPARVNAEPPQSVTGLWLNPDQGWIVEYAACPGGMCGTLVSFRKGNAPENAPRDQQNPDRTLRNTPLCGLRVVGGLTPSRQGDGKWEGGWIYDPQTGGTYRALVEQVGADTVKVRGYLLTPVLGRTVTLERVSGAIERCRVPVEEAVSRPAAILPDSLANYDPADS